MRRTRISLLLVLGMLAALLPMGAVAPAFAANDHLMLTELVVTPDEGEFIEIHNPTAGAIDLSNYYLTDATFAGGNTYYYNIVTGTNAGGGSYGDFHAQFPVGASIAPGEYQTVSMAGSADFATAYGIAPTYELFEDDAIPDTVPDMREAVAGSINGQGGLSNSGEVAVLYTWEGASDLVTDIDYAVWGDKVEAVDKTGVAIDGPDGDADASAYLPDTAIGSQDVVATDAHQIGEAFRRADLNEGTETGAGGNGINGDDETSENTSVTWVTAIPSPGASEPTPPVPELVINEIMPDPSAVDDSDGEWFEIYNAGAADVDIDGWTIRDDGSNSHVIANGGSLVISAGGYLVLGNNADALSNGGVTVDYAYPSSWYLGNTDDEVVLLDTALVEVDRVEYDGGPVFPDPTGASMALDDPANDNNDGANWCTASTPFGDGDFGTPGAENDCAAPPVPELVINEIIQNPAAVDDSAGEWFEIYNAGAAEVDIDGWTISDNDTDDHVIANGGPLVVPAGGYLVLARNGDSLVNGGVTADYEYGSDISLANGADEVVLLDTALVEVDRVEYDGGPVFPDPTGASMALDDPANDNNDGANWCTASTPFGDGDFGTPGAANDCALTITKIHDVQGDGFASLLDGQIVTIEGVVVGDFQGADQIGGFHLQEEDLEIDGDPLTSEGVYVYAPNAIDVSIGDTVRVTGEVDEYYDLTEIRSFEPDAAVLIDPVGPATPASVTLPIGSDAVFEAVEGMSVVFPQALYISEYYNFARYGEIVLSADRAAQPTAVHEPGSAEAADLADLNARSRITIDDGRGGQNPDPAIHPNGGVFDLTNRFRGGDTITNMPGVMDYAYGDYKVQMIGGGIGGDYVAANPRPLAPAAVGGDVTVATFNVLNYFTTLDNSGPICGPLGNLGCRGADDAGEFTRQRDKIIDAITVMDADVVGLMEIENHADDNAVDDLVTGLNAVAGAGTYAAIESGPVGTDAIKVAIVYKPAKVTPYGAHAVLDTEAFLDPANTGLDRNRAALAQSFVDNANGGVFTVVVNHLKSKGGSEIGDDDPVGICLDGDPSNDIPDCDQGDGQGYFNHTRTLAASVLADWLQTDPTGSGDADVLLIGDLNAYDKEDPIGVFDTRGYTDLVYQYGGEFAYSYVFDGQLGYLDYIMANGGMASQVTGTTVWHINTDEPNILDYDTSYKQPAQQALYEPNAFRSSDHDPVIVGLELTVTPKQAKNHSIGVLSELLPTGSWYYDWRIKKAIRSIEDSLNPAYWVDDFHLTDKGNKVFDEEKKAVKDLMRVHGSVEPEVDAVIAALVNADEELAATAIDDAVAAGGSQRYIDKALREMKEAQKDLDRNRPDKAIDHYKKAWQYAQKALAEAPVRFATFNASLNRDNAGDLMAELSAPGSAQPATIAEIIQRNRPDVVLINEFDYDANGVAAEGFQNNYLSIPQNGAAPIVYPYRYVAPSNTGIPSGFDLDNNGTTDEANDAYGFGDFEGQYAFVVYSMYPIDVSKIRTFQNFLWKDMPGALLPENPDGTPWFDDDELNVVRLSSKNHVDVPIRVNGDTIHFLVSHPTPPVFDDVEDRNGKRNYDEIRFWADYVSGGKSARYIYDDAGKKGGLSRGAEFVIAGDLNSDPFDGDSYPGSAQLLLDHPRINDSMTPSSLGGTEQAAEQAGANLNHDGDPAYDTGDFYDVAPGNLRVDYVLPRYDMDIVASGVFWPEASDPLFPLVGTFPFPSSDHRLVWIDLDLDGHGCRTYYGNHRGR